MTKRTGGGCGSDRDARQAGWSVVERVEPRTLLSAAVSHGLLSIDGTPRADTIVLTMNSRKNVTLRIDGVETSYPKHSFGRIRIRSGRGDDLVTVGNDTAPILTSVNISAAGGADTVVGGGGNDVISGGPGCDLLAGAAGNDHIDGNGNADDLHGGDGNDTLRGGRGDDQIHDDDGIDRAFGNDGVDLFFQNDGVKDLRDKARTEHVMSEPVWVANPLSAADQLLVNDHPEALTLNAGAWHLADGSLLDGGILSVGGSSLVVSNAGIDHWNSDGLVKNGAGTLTLSGLNAYTGLTTITAGATISASAVNHVDGIAGNLRLNGSISTAQGSLQFGNSNTYTGSVTVNSGTLLVGSGAGGLTATSPNPGLFGGTLTLNRPILPVTPPLNGIVSGDHAVSFIIPAGAIITQSDGTTTTAAAGSTTIVAHGGTVTYSDGHSLSIADGYTLTLTCPADPATPPADGNPNDSGDNTSDNGTPVDNGDTTAGGDGSDDTSVDPTVDDGDATADPITTTPINSGDPDGGDLTPPAGDDSGGDEGPRNLQNEQV